MLEQIFSAMSVSSTFSLHNQLAHLAKERYKTHIIAGQHLCICRGVFRLLSKMLDNKEITTEASLMAAYVYLYEEALQNPEEVMQSLLKGEGLNIDLESLKTFIY